MIPVAKPALRFEADVPEAYYSYDRAVVGHGLVLVVGGWDQYQQGDPPPVLVALDAATGRERFRIRVPVLRPGATECQVALPVFLPDARILLAVYQWDVSLNLYLIDGAGRILWEQVQEDGPGLWIHGSDSGIKLWIEAIGLADDAFVLSWTYRSRTNNVQCRAIETGALRWSASERLLAIHGAYAVTETDPPRRGPGASIAGRTIADGVERWRLPAVDHRHRFAAGLHRDTVLLVDRTARAAHRDTRDRGVVELAERTGSEDLDALEARWNREHPAPGCELVALDPATGAERWRAGLTGLPTSVACTPTLAAAIVVANDGSTSVELVGADGRCLGASSPITAPRDDAWNHHWSPPAPVIAAVDDTHLLVVHEGELVWSPIADPARVAWRMPLPADLRVERHNPADRDLKEASLAVADRRLYLRVGAKLWCFG